MKSFITCHYRIKETLECQLIGEQELCNIFISSYVICPSWKSRFNLWQDRFKWCVGVKVKFNLWNNCCIFFFIKCCAKVFAFIELIFFLKDFCDSWGFVYSCKIRNCCRLVSQSFFRSMVCGRSSFFREIKNIPRARLV